jgi:PhnB protein
MLVQPYLFFDGRCEEAITFYVQALGAEVEMLMRYKEAPDPPPPGTREDYEHKVMHANLRSSAQEVIRSPLEG